LGYYSSFSDAAAHFYIDHLPKGSYVFEFELSVTHSGSFTNGLSSIECLYAPQYRNITGGNRLTIE
jgi:hypothetical protein